MNKVTNTSTSVVLSRKREPIYDFIRVISCLCIIVIHCTDALIDGNSYDYIWCIRECYSVNC